MSWIDQVDFIGTLIVLLAMTVYFGIFAFQHPWMTRTQIVMDQWPMILAAVTICGLLSLLKWVVNQWSGGSTSSRSHR